MVTKFTPEFLNALKRSTATHPFERFPVSKYVPKDLHLRRTEKLQKTRLASILIPLCNRNGVASILYTLRSQKVGTHKGQVSFPGGMCDAGEDDATTALRETYEEIGESVGPVTILGLGQTVYSITGVLVTPVLGFIERDVGDLSHFTPEEDEVESIFSRSIIELNDPINKSYETYEKDNKKVTMPVYGGDMSGKGFGSQDHADLIAPDGKIWKVRKERIWGLTGLVTESVMDVITAVDSTRQ
jgi:nudix motif 8